jgi:hypothetical protein
LRLEQSTIAGTISARARHKVKPAPTAKKDFDWRSHAVARGADSGQRQLTHVQRGPPDLDKQPITAAAFVQEMGVIYRYNDVLQGLSQNLTLEECADACRSAKPAKCMAWSWLPASSAASPSTCSFKSARGTTIESSPGAVSGYLTGEKCCWACWACVGMVPACACLPAIGPALASNSTSQPPRSGIHMTKVHDVECVPGTAPYTLEPGKQLRGHTIANATVHSLEDCATACTAFQGSRSHSRCSAWTWWQEHADRPGVCKLKSTRGSASQAASDGVVSGYLEGALAASG